MYSSAFHNVFSLPLLLIEPNDRHTYESNILQSAVVYSTRNKTEGRRFLHSYTPLDGSLQGATGAHRDSTTSQDPEISVLGKLNEIPVWDNMSENKLLTPEIRSILQSDYYYDDLKASKGVFSKISQSSLKVRIVRKDINSACINYSEAEALNRGRKESIRKIEEHLTKEKYEQMNYTKALKDIKKKKEAAEKEYLLLTYEQDRLKVLQEKHEEHILKNEGLLSELNKLKKHLVSKYKGNVKYYYLQ